MVEYLRFWNEIIFQFNDRAIIEDPIVFVTNLGWLKGTIAHTKWTNQTYYQFLGVPYAEAPSGSRRFKVIWFNVTSPCHLLYMTYTVIVASSTDPTMVWYSWCNWNGTTVCSGWWKSQTTVSTARYWRLFKYEHFYTSYSIKSSGEFSRFSGVILRSWR